MFRHSCTVLRFLGFTLIAVGCFGCVAVRNNVPRPVTHAFENPETTTLGKIFAARQERSPGESGFRVLEYGREALIARTALADAAERTIDAQYFIYDPDAAGSLLAQGLIQAADRGVHVRLLLDDNNLGEDREMATLCAHPNIEVRVFNPFKYRARWARLPQFAIDFNRMVRRMHNKIFIVDNAVAIIGGRNIGNNYFSLDSNSNFRDFDLLMAGPIARDASIAFDEYWNSTWSIPARALVRKAATFQQFEALRPQIAARVKTVEGLEKENLSRRIEYVKELETANDALVWAKGEIISEPPRKIQRATHETTEVSDRLAEEWTRTKSELLVECAYLVPTREVAAAFTDLRKRGVEVKVMTNTLESTNLPLVYTAYARHRRALLRSGIELYEYQGEPGLTRSERKWYKPRSSLSALHSKVLVFDRRRVWVGSFNLDPRSVNLNTEIAVLVDSEKLAAQMADYIAEDFSPKRSWRVQLEPVAISPQAPHRGMSVNEHVTWSGEYKGKFSKRYLQPASSVWQRCKEFLCSLIPGIESQL